MKQALQFEFAGGTLSALLVVGVLGNSLVGATRPHPNRFVPTNDSLSQFDSENAAVDLCAVASRNCLTPKTNGPLRVDRYSLVKCAETLGNARVVDPSHTRCVRVHGRHFNYKAQLASDRRDVKSLSATAKGRRVS